MITFITGNPGCGKTAAVVSMLEALGKDRLLYCNGVNGLTLDHLPLTDDEARDWPNTVPDGSCVVIDEVQRLWRPRAPGSKVPEAIQALETHRHRGLDFYIISQKPSLCDKNIRDLTGRHVHLRDIGMLGRWWYEWPECAEQAATTWKNAPIKKRYRLPKGIFDKYKSASIHVKPVRSVPWVVFVLGAALLATAALVWRTYGVVTSKMAPVAAAPSVVSSGLDSITRPRGGTSTAPVGQPFSLAAFVPVQAEFPESAPAYDALRVVTTMRQIAGGWCSRGVCKCIDQQGIYLDLAQSVCNEFVAKGRFNPYKPLPPQQSSIAQQGIRELGEANSVNPGR